MKILLINVALRPKSLVKFLPLGLAYIATALKNAGFTFDLLDVDAYRYSDDEIRAFLAKNHYDVILMGCIITGYKTIKEYARMIREFYPDSIILWVFRCRFNTGYIARQYRNEHCDHRRR